MVGGEEVVPLGQTMRESSQLSENFDSTRGLKRISTWYLKDTLSKSEY